MSEQLPDLLEATIDELRKGLEQKHFTSKDLVQAYSARIAQVNKELKAIIQISPAALKEAARLDLERQQGFIRSALHGIPIAVKATINTCRDLDLDTSSGSHALVGARSNTDAYAVSKLRDAGAIILATCNLSQWNNARSMGYLPSGFSPVGGMCKSVYFKDSSPGGSNSGGSVATTLGLCAASVGAETNASLLYPASVCNVVGLRPTIGLISRTGCSPISLSYDTLGPVARTVQDAALLLSHMAGPDPLDTATLCQPAISDYVKAAQRTSLKGVRLGFPRTQADQLWPFGDKMDLEIVKAMEEAIICLRQLGADVVDIEIGDLDKVLNRTELHKVAEVDFPQDLKAYLGLFDTNPNSIHSVKDLIDYIEQHPELESPHGLAAQDFFQLAAKNQNRATHPRYAQWRATVQSVARKSIDSCFRQNTISAIVFPTVFFTASAKCGYPQLVVPLGFWSDHTPAEVQSGPAGPFADEIKTYDTHPNQPFCLSFSGLAFSEDKLLGYAHAFEQASQVRHKHQILPELLPSTQLRDVLKND